MFDVGSSMFDVQLSLYRKGAKNAKGRKGRFLMGKTKRVVAEVGECGAEGAQVAGASFWSKSAEMKARGGMVKDTTIINVTSMAP